MFSGYGGSIWVCDHIRIYGNYGFVSISIAISLSFMVYLIENTNLTAVFFLSYG
jgi:hypothetical protein